MKYDCQLVLCLSSQTDARNNNLISKSNVDLRKIMTYCACYNLSKKNGILLDNTSFIMSKSIVV